MMRVSRRRVIRSGAAALLATGLLPWPAHGDAGIAALWQGIRWGESNQALLARFGRRATILPRPLDFGDSYARIVLRDVAVGGVRLIAFLQMDKATGGLKRIQLERPRHAVNPPAFRAVLAALAGEFGSPDSGCVIPPAWQNGYQAAAERVWRRDGLEIRAVFRDTTLEAVEGCLDRSLTSGPCGLTGQMLIRIGPPAAIGSGCPARGTISPK